MSYLWQWQERCAWVEHQRFDAPAPTGLPVRMGGAIVLDMRRAAALCFAASKAAILVAAGCASILRGVTCLIGDSFPCERSSYAKFWSARTNLTCCRMQENLRIRLHFAGFCYGN